MPDIGAPMQQNNTNASMELLVERPPNENQPPIVRQITQTDHLNKKLLVSVLERMKNCDGYFDKFMETEKTNCETDNDSEFE